MPLLQIDIAATDATGGVATATLEVEVAEPGTVPAMAHARSSWMNIPPGAAVHAAATFPAPDVQADAEPAAPPSGRQAPQARLMSAGPEAPQVTPAVMEQPVPGLSNSTGHKGATSDFVPPQVTQAQRSKTLGRFTGGYR